MVASHPLGYTSNRTGISFCIITTSHAYESFYINCSEQTILFCDDSVLAQFYSPFAIA